MIGRLHASIAVLCLAAAAVLGLSACGGSSADLLPGKTADQINQNLDQVRALVAEGDCAGAEDAVDEVSEEVEALGKVDAKLKAALREGTARLADVVSHCEEESAAVTAAKEEEAEQEAAEAVAEGEEEEQRAAAEGEEEAEREKAKEKKAKGKQGAEKLPEEPAEEPAEEEAQGGNEGVEKGKGPPAEAPGGNESSAGGIGPGVGVE
jgi:hypothetical protein